jgi:hypothetical protein
MTNTPDEFREQIFPMLDHAEAAGQENRVLIVAGGRVHTFAMDAESGKGPFVGRHMEMPFETAVRGWQGLRRGQHLGVVMLILPVDAEIGAEAMQAVLAEAAARAGFTFVTVPWKSDTAKAVEIWRVREAWQEVH